MPKVFASVRIACCVIAQSAPAPRYCRFHIWTARRSVLRARIGPYARLRPGALLADEVHIGNFVEVKASTLGRGSKANHLAYVGDATVGANVNIGAGTITANYDGARKHRTVIGDDVSIGSNAVLVAPVTIGAWCDDRWRFDDLEECA